MKRIFLTSAVALCVACPAFAATTDIAANASNAQCKQDVLGVDNGSTTFEAKWTADSYNVTYAPGAHGTGGATYTNGVTFDSDYTVLAPSAVSTPVVAATGYTFAGWSDGTETRAAGYTYNPYATAGALTLTAQWTPIDYTITYNCGAPKTGSASTPVGPTTASTSVSMDGPYTLAAANNCTLPGYTFAGWSCPNLPGTPGTNGFAGGATGTYSYAGNVICTAQWTQNTIGLTWYNDSVANEGTAISGATPTCTYDETITLPTQPTKTGYTFGGWKVRQ